MNVTTRFLPLTVDPDSLNVVQRTVEYMVLAIPALTCFYISVLIFSTKKRLVITQIQKEKGIASLHLFGTKVSIVYKFVSYESASSLQGISSYLDIVVGSKSVVQTMSMNILVKNFATQKRKIETALNLIIYILTYILGYGLLSLILN